MVRLKKLYFDEIVPKLMTTLGISNVFAVPRLEKVVLNMGIGEAVASSEVTKIAKRSLALISGQEPVLCKSKKSVAGFKLREGQMIGCKVTMRGDRMYEFLDRLINIALPRVRDFRGVSRKSFDGNGNYSLGIKEQIVFPELVSAGVDSVYGMDVTITTTNVTNDDGAYHLLKAFDFPFVEEGV